MPNSDERFDEAQYSELPKDIEKYQATWLWCGMLAPTELIGGVDRLTRQNEYGRYVPNWRAAVHDVPIDVRHATAIIKLEYLHRVYVGEELWRVAPCGAGGIA